MKLLCFSLEDVNLCHSLYIYGVTSSVKKLSETKIGKTMKQTEVGWVLFHFLLS